LGGVAKAVGKAISGAAKAVGNVVDFAVDKIAKPAVDFVGDTLKGLAEDPLGTAAKIALYATGNAWAIPLVDGASVAVKGGDIGDVLKTVAVSYASQKIAGEVSDYVGEAMGNADLFNNAVANEIVTDAVTKGATSATYAVIYGTDPVEAFFTGGVSGATSAALGQIKQKLGWNFTNPNTGKTTPIPAVVENIVGSAISAQLSGSEVDASVIANAVTRGLLTTDLVQKMAASGGIAINDPTALAYTTAAIQRVSAIALSGGSGEQAAAVLKNVMSAYGTQALNKAIDDSKVGDLIGNTLDKISGDYQRLEESANKIDELATTRASKSEQYEAMRVELKDKYDAIIAESERLEGAKSLNQRITANPITERDLYTEQVNRVKNSDLTLDSPAYKAAINKLNKDVKKFNALYKDYNPQMETLLEEVNDLSKQIGTGPTEENPDAEFTGLYKELDARRARMQVSTERLDESLNPLYEETAKAFTLTLNPLFAEESYRNINDLGDDVNVYEHFLGNTGNPTVFQSQEQYEAAQKSVKLDALVAVVQAAGLDSADIDPKSFHAIHKELADLPISSLREILDDPNTTSSYVRTLEQAILQNADPALSKDTLDDATRTSLERLGFDTADMTNGDALTNQQKVALIADAQEGVNTAKLADGVTYEDVIYNPIAIDIDVNGNRVFRPLETSEQYWDPNHGRVNKTTTYDAIGREVRTILVNDDGESIGFITNTYDGVSTADNAELLTTIVITRGADSDVAKEAADAMGFTDQTIDTVSSLLNWADENDYDNAQDTIANVLKATGGILKAFNGVSALFGVAPSDTAVGQFAKKLVKLGENSNTEEYKENLKELEEQMSSSGFKDLRKEALMATGLSEEEATEITQSEYDALPWYDKAIDKMSALAGGITEHPTTFLAEYVGVEAMQELVPLAVGGVATLGVKGAAYAAGKTLSTRIAARTGLGAAAATDLTESFGGTAADTYDRAYSIAIDSGMSEADAQNYALELAVQSGAVAATLTAASFGVGGLALEKAILNKDNVSGFLADGVTELTRRIANGGVITLKEGVTESIEEGLTQAFTASHLKQLDPSIDIAGEVTASAFMGFIVGSSVSGGAYGLSQTKDAYANAVSLLSPDINSAIEKGDIAAATRALDTIGITDPVVVGNVFSQIDPETYASTGAVIDAYENASGVWATEEEGGYTPTSADIDSFVGTQGGTALQDAVNTSIDQKHVDTQEVIDAAAAQGVTITAEDAQQYIGWQDETETLGTVAEVYDPLGTTDAEIQEAFALLEYNPVNNEVGQFVQEGNEADILTNLEAYVDPRQITADEVAGLFAGLDYTPSEQEISNFVGQGGANYEANAPLRLEQYVDPLQVTEEDARGFFSDLGYTPTDEEVQQFVAQVEETTQSEVISKYVDPRQVTLDEIAAIADEEGLTFTEALAQTYVGQGDEAYQETQLEAARAEYDPLATTQDEAAQFFEESGYTATPEEIADFVASKTEEEQITAIGEYVNPRQVTETEARAYLTDIGYNPTDEEVQKFVGQLNDVNYQTTQELAISEYVDPRYLSADEVLAAYQDLGLQNVTQEDLDRFVRQYDPTTSDYTLDEFEATSKEGISDYLPVAAANVTSQELQQIAEYVGKPAQDVTQTDIDFVADVIAQNQALNEQQITQYDVTGDNVVDIADQQMLEQLLAGDVTTSQVAPTSVFAPTGLYQNQNQTMDMVQQMAQDTSIEMEKQFLQQGGRDFLQQALMAPDAMGQQVTVETPDPLQLNYIYDWSSIFATPSQAAMFPSPYAKGGQVEDTTDKLLRIIGGKK